MDFAPPGNSLAVTSTLLVPSSTGGAFFVARGDGSRRRANATCSHCGAPYYRQPKERGRTWCGKECSNRIHEKYAKCGFCGQEFLAGGKRDGVMYKPKKYCSCACANNRRWFAGPDEKDRRLAEVDALIESGVPIKAVSKKTGIGYAVVKKRCEERHGSIPPTWARAIALFEAGDDEATIGAKVGRSTSTIIAGLLRFMGAYKPRYVNADARGKMAADERRRAKRAFSAKCLWAYRKTKNVRLAAKSMGIGIEALRCAIAGIGAYQRIRAKTITHGDTNRKKMISKISNAYANESEFSDALAGRIADVYPNTQREVASGSTTRTDIVVLSGGKKVVIECKWDVKITNIHKGAGQAAIAQKKLGADHCIVCWPDDVIVSAEAIDDASMLGATAVSEGLVIPTLRKWFSRGAPHDGHASG